VATAGLTAALLTGRRALFLGLLALLPALIPIAVALYDEHSGLSGLDLYAWIAEYGFLGTLAPLAAIFLGTSLVAEDVENGTAAYLLTRGVPRSALVLGKLAVYVAIVAAAFLPAMGLTYLSAVLTTPTPAGGAAIFATTFGVTCLAIVTYGALCCTLGTVASRPVVMSAVFVFGWEPLTRLIPGHVDFLTIKKHLLALWPVVAMGGEPGTIEVARKVIDVSRGEAVLALTITTAALAAIATYALRSKEFVRGQNLA
jgi:ABC-2 type transport system permease protein